MIEKIDVDKWMMNFECFDTHTRVLIYLAETNDDCMWEWQTGKK